MMPSFFLIGDRCASFYSFAE